MSRINQRRRLSPNVESLDDRTLLSSLVHGAAHHPGRHHGHHAIVSQHLRTLHASARALGNAHFRGAFRMHIVHPAPTGDAGGRSIAPSATAPQFVSSPISVARAEPTGPGINLEPPAPGLNYGVSTTSDGSQTLARDATAPSPTTVTTTVQSGPGINLETPGPGLHYGVSIASDGSQTLAR